ncbi:MAG TPA: protease inhibitor I42 family protein [Solirubrobacteraceae bacterium]|nr:protease inhibitor I42 family protein [Solirubrobacteraceae bacterium]
MPRKLVRRGLRELGIGTPRDPLDVYALSLWLGTSYTATARQLAVLKMVDYGTADAWAKVEPATVKHTLVGDMVPDDLRNDVWWLDARNNRHPISARPGDRLVVTLEEIPSSGFSWRIDELPPTLTLLADSFQDHWEPAFSSVPRSNGTLLGGASPRAFLFEVAAGEHDTVMHVALVKEQSWNPDSRSDEFELLLTVSAPLRGIQVPEEAFALVG